MRTAFVSTTNGIITVSLTFNMIAVGSGGGKHCDLATFVRIGAFAAVEIPPIARGAYVAV